jgi:hypothetical protein
VKPDITVGPKAGKYTIRDRGSARQNIAAIRRRANKLGYSRKAIERRWPSVQQNLEDKLVRKQLKKMPSYHKGDDTRRGA